MPDTNFKPFDLLARSNVNAVWGALTMEVLARLGVETIVVSPGSRSTPLAVAAARNPKLEAIPILDERSAGFFALGLAKRTHKPVVLVCTSGSAVVNYYPAVLEASMSGTPLMVLTADRPPELRDCAAGQTIDQTKIFGKYVRAFHEVALPELSPSMLAYLRQNLVHAVNQSLQGNPGPIHLNFPFREPLSPDADCAHVIEAEAMERAATVSTRLCESVNALTVLDAVAIERLSSHRRGLIVVGAVNPQEGDDVFANVAFRLSDQLGWPILSDVLNPLRGYADQSNSIVCHYDVLLRQDRSKLPEPPTAILQIGPLPTSKALRSWLAAIEATAFLLSDRPLNTDPLHRIATPLYGTASALSAAIHVQTADANWLAQWRTLEQQTAAQLDARFEQMEVLFEGKIAWLLSRHLPARTSVFIANSMSVRYAEYFWRSSERTYSIHFNRGTNGIDGTLGTALGVAHRGNPSVLLSGDLAFLHDTNALLAARELSGSLTVVLVNNQGGGIFEYLPVTRLNDSFETYFATPQAIQFKTLCQAYGVSYRRISDWDSLIEAIRILPAHGVRVLEVCTDRKADQEHLQELLHSSRDALHESHS